MIYSEKIIIFLFSKYIYRHFLYGKCLFYFPHSIVILTFKTISWDKPNRYNYLRFNKMLKHKNVIYLKSLHHITIVCYIKTLHFVTKTNIYSPIYFSIIYKYLTIDFTKHNVQCS